MKRTSLVITLTLVLLIVGGYFLFNRFAVKDTVRPWDLVPQDALVVYEKNKCNSCVESLKRSAFWEILQSAVRYKNAGDSIIKTLEGELKGSSGLLISTHITKKDELDFVYYLTNDGKFMSSLLKKNQKYKIVTREFNEVKINDLRFLDQSFSYGIIDGVWFGSFSPILVEDVIRNFRAGEGSFRQDVIRGQTFSSVQEDAGNLYINLAKISSLLSVFSGDQNLVGAIGRLVMMDVRDEENRIVLNGFTSDTTGQSDYLLSIFQHQLPVTFGLDNMISNRSMAVSSYGISDGVSFATDLKAYQEKNNARLADTLRILSKDLKIDFESLLRNVSDEIDVSFAESSSHSEFATKTVMIETAKKQEWVNAFSKIANKFSVDTIFYESYGDYEIREIPVHKFMEKLLWPLVNGFPQNFYTTVGNVIVIGDNLEELKRVLDDIDNEDTWGKSVSTNHYLETTLLESNVSLYLNPGKSWSYLSQQLHPKWQAFVKENSRLLRSSNLTSIQFSHLNNNFYTSIISSYTPLAEKDSKGVVVAGKQTSTGFDRGIVNLYTVKSHVNRSNEILVQDSVNDLSLISADGDVLWKLAIGDRIVGEVSQIDYFKNGKLQYLFATENAIHVVDRLGNYVRPFPAVMSLVDIEFLSVVDYDNSKKYRFLVADQRGKLWMVDKTGTPLEGWMPKDVGGPLAMAPKHHRIKGKDYIIAIRKDGQVLVTNRRGENLRRFPLNSESTPNGEYFLEIGNSVANTFFVIASSDGYRIKFNLDGKVQSKEALPKTSVSSMFSLVAEKNNKSYLILQQDGKQLNVTDPSGKKLITASIGNVSPSDVKYYDFGSGRSLIGIRDRVQGFVYIYDGSGTLLTTPPIEGSAFDIRSIQPDVMGVFVIMGRSLKIQPL